jgi:prolipoprotein diacylglyceryltransferase
MGAYLVLSSMARFGIEFTRFHEQGLHYGLSWTQWISIGLAALGVLMLARPTVPSKVSPPLAA